MSSEWEKQANRERVKSLLGMGFTPTWLEELLDTGDKLLKENNFFKRQMEDNHKEYSDLALESFKMKEKLEAVQNKADFADSVYELSKKAWDNKTPIFIGNVYQGLINKYEKEVLGE